MDAASALADLTEISSQVDSAVVLDAAGTVLGSTLDDAARSERLARAGIDLIAAAADGIPGEGRELTQLEAALREGSIFAAREGGHTIVATTTAAPSSGLVFYDLRTCLRSLVQESESAAKPARKRATTGEARA
jgi:hypothetical protein